MNKAYKMKILNEEEFEILHLNTNKKYKIVKKKNIDINKEMDCNYFHECFINFLSNIFEIKECD